MTAIKKGRWTAQPEADFVVSIIGVRINRWWMIHRWLPLVLAMRRVVRDLSARPELGFRGGKTWLGRTFVLIQYWHSFEQLETYPSAEDLEHLPAWEEFNRIVGTDGAAGIFHEIYRIKSGDYESVYVNMPRTLLGNCSNLVKANGRLPSARGRLGRPNSAPSNANALKPRAQTHMRDKLHAHVNGSTDFADLVDTVEKALMMADAAGLGQVGIDLCSALERLQKLDTCNT